MLSNGDIINLIKNNQLIIDPYYEKNVGCASIDLSLADKFIQYTREIDSHNVVPTNSFSDSTITLPPGGFILGMTRERICIPPKYYGFIETRGNFARAGIAVSSNDGHIDPGTNGTLTLEIHNRNTVPVTLHAGDFICQLFLVALDSPSTHLYRGKYAHQNQPTVFVP